MDAQDDTLYTLRHVLLSVYSAREFSFPFVFTQSLAGVF